jgi:hypothetical protein
MEAVKGCETAGATWDGAGPDGFLFQDPALAVPASAIVAGDFNFHAGASRVSARRSLGSGRCLAGGRQQRGGRRQLSGTKAASTMSSLTS